MNGKMITLTTLMATNEWDQENVADINFWCFIKLKDWAFQ